MALKINESFNYFTRLTNKLIKNYDPLNIYHYNYWIYVFCGFWKYKSPKKWKTRLYNVYQKSLVVFYGVSVIFFAIDAYLVRKDFKKLTFNMSSSVLVVMTVIKIRLMLNSREDIEGIHERLNNKLNIEESEEDKFILKKYANGNVQLTIVFYGVLAIGFPLRVIADTALDTKTYLIPIPFQDKIEDYYEYVYAQQVVVSFHFMSTVLAHDLTGLVFILRFTAHFEILEKKFHSIKSLYPKKNFEKYVKGYADISEEKNVVNDVLISKTNYSEKMTRFLNSHRVPKFRIVKWMKNANSREDKTFQILIEIVEHHQKLLEVLKTFSTVYSKPLLVQILGMATLLGILVIHVMFLSKEMTPLLLQQIIFAGSTATNIIILSSFGSKLSCKSTDAAFALYDLPWYEMSVKNRKAINLILQKFMLAPMLKGGGIIPIDRVTFIKFMQTSYNMVAVLRNKIKITEKNSNLNYV